MAVREPPRLGACSASPPHNISKGRGVVNAPGRVGGRVPAGTAPYSILIELNHASLKSWNAGPASSTSSVW